MPQPPDSHSRLLLPPRHDCPQTPSPERRVWGQQALAALAGAWCSGPGAGGALASALALLSPPEASAAPAGPRDPMRLGVDVALVDSGLAKALQAAFARDTGVAIHLMPEPATAALQALERGERDAALCNAPQAEAALEHQGLIHDRRAVALSRLVLVGPAAWRKPLDAASDILIALSRVVRQDRPFLSATDGSGLHQAELALWKKAVTTPQGERYRKPTGQGSLLEQALASQACVLIDRALWMQYARNSGRGATALAVLCEGDRLLELPVHVMRGFRSSHPAAKLWSNWISGPHGRAVVAAHSGYEAPARTPP